MLLASCLPLLSNPQPLTKRQGVQEQSEACESRKEPTDSISSILSILSGPSSFIAYRQTSAPPPPPLAASSRQTTRKTIETNCKHPCCCKIVVFLFLISTTHTRYSRKHTLALFSTLTGKFRSSHEPDLARHKTTSRSLRRWTRRLSSFLRLLYIWLDNLFKISTTDHKTCTCLVC